MIDGQKDERKNYAALVTAARDFVEKVQSGRARSTDSYNKFLKALAQVDQ